VTISSLATAGGTLVLAVATFGSTRSANRAARASEQSLRIAAQSLRIGERSLEIGLRPLLLPSRWDDPAQKIMYGDEQWFRLPGGSGIGEIRSVDDVETVYLGLSLHNAGSGLAVIHGWRFYPDRPQGPDQHHPAPEEFRTNFRDLYIPVNGTGFWQAAYRDTDDAEYATAVEVIKARHPLGIDLLYGDYEGGQRMITRFSMTPRDPVSAALSRVGGGPPAAGAPAPGDGPGQGSQRSQDGLWLPSVVRHWNIDRPDPREPTAGGDPPGTPGSGA
jgi:hypothetical protein